LRRDYTNTFIEIVHQGLNALFSGMNWSFDILAEELEENVVDPPPHDQVAR
jgi:hypothetical protein